MTVGQDADLSLTNGIYDFQIDSNGDILTKDFFDTSLLMSLFCERRASASEMPNSELRRGWIGNESTPDFEIGSKLWLYSQARVTRTTLNGIETTVKNGLQWQVEDNIAVSIDVTSSLGNGSIAVTLDIKRVNSSVERRYFELWNNTGVL